MSQTLRLCDIPLTKGPRGLTPWILSLNTLTSPYHQAEVLHNKEILVLTIALSLFPTHTPRRYRQSSQHFPSILCT
jgi:hypothetical protein